MENKKKTNLKRILAACSAAALCLVQPLSVMSSAEAPVLGSAQAEASDVMFAEALSGSCGENVRFSLSTDGTLTVSGTGAMYDYNHINGTGTVNASDDAPWYSVRESIKKIVVGGGVTYIGNGAMQDCVNATSVTLNSGLVSIGEWAFSKCASLTTVTMPDTLRNIGSYAFRTCDELKTVKLNKGLEEIGDLAFTDCRELADINLPEGLKVLGKSAFEFCYGLKGIVIPSTLPYVDACTFKGCGLKTVVFKNGPKGIYEEAFKYCSSLERVSLPKSYTFIENNAFSDCTSLLSLSFSDGMTSIDSAFVGAKNIKNIYYEGSEESFKAIFNGKLYGADVHYNFSADDFIPKNVKATTGIGSVKLTWDEVSDATMYRVQQYIDGEWKTVAYPKTNGYSVTGLTPGVKCRFRVIALAFNDLWCTPCGSVYATPAAGSVPRDFKATAGNHSVRLTWSPVSGAVKYRIQHYTGEEWKTVAYPKKTSHTITGLNNDRKYVYRVLAYVNGSWGGASAKVLVIPTSETTPLYFKATTGDGVAILTWGSVANAERYRVQLYTNGAWKTVKYPTTTSYTATGLKNGGKYVYRVIAYVNGEWGVPSEKILVVPQA